MGEVLSQNEIDNLLAALSSGEVDAEEMKGGDEKHVKDYDFARPAKFSKEHLRTLEIIFEHYGRLLSTNLPGYLRKNIQIEVVNAEAVTYQEFSNALSNPVILGVSNFSPMKGNILIEMGINLGYAMIDRMLGGEGEPLEKSRDFSEIELTILEKILGVCVKLMREPWANVLEINPYLERIETNSQFAQIISPSEMTALVTLNIHMGEIEGLMNICIPYMAVEDIMDRLSTKYWYSTLQDKDENDYEEAIESLIKRAQIPITAMLGTTELSVQEFAGLQVGDIIRLNVDVEDELNVYVGNIKKFTALPGSSGENYAVRVTSVLREEQ